VLANPNANLAVDAGRNYAFMVAWDGPGLVDVYNLNTMQQLTSFYYPQGAPFPSTSAGYPVGLAVTFDKIRGILWIGSNCGTPTQEPFGK